MGGYLGCPTSRGCRTSRKKKFRCYAMKIQNTKIRLTSLLKSDFNRPVEVRLQQLQQGQRGVSLYLAMIVMTVLLGIALGISSIFLGQTKILRGLGYSVIAFYAADAGIEEVLINRDSPNTICLEASPCSLANGAEYYLDIKPAGVGCPAVNYCIKSIGQYKETRRAIEIQY